MKTIKPLRLLIILLIVLSNIGCDQISKTVVRQKIDYNESIPLLRGYFTLTKVENTGAFLSLGDALPAVVKLIVLSLFPLLAMAAGLYYLIKTVDMNKMLLIGISCVIGGGIGNLYDRMLHGSVTDFMHIDFVLFETGIFNMADVSIMAGMFLCIWYSLSKKPVVIENPL
jgi:signal peptidase II